MRDFDPDVDFFSYIFAETFTEASTRRVVLVGPLSYGLGLALRWSSVLASLLSKPPRRTFRVYGVT